MPGTTTGSPWPSGVARLAQVVRGRARAGPREDELQIPTSLAESASTPRRAARCSCAGGCRSGTGRIGRGGRLRRGVRSRPRSRPSAIRAGGSGRRVPRRRSSRAARARPSLVTSSSPTACESTCRPAAAADEFEAGPVPAALGDVDQLGGGVACGDEVVDGGGELERAARRPLRARSPCVDGEIERRQGVEDPGVGPDGVRRPPVGDLAGRDEFFDRPRGRQVRVEEIGPDEIRPQPFERERPVRGVAADSVGAGGRALQRLEVDDDGPGRPRGSAAVIEARSAPAAVVATSSSSAVRRRSAACRSRPTSSVASASPSICVCSSDLISASSARISSIFVSTWCSRVSILSVFDATPAWEGYPGSYRAPHQAALCSFHGDSSARVLDPMVDARVRPRAERLPTRMRPSWSGVRRRPGEPVRHRRLDRRAVMSWVRTPVVAIPDRRTYERCGLPWGR